jgi:hypothetical protein
MNLYAFFLVIMISTSLGANDIAPQFTQDGQIIATSRGGLCGSVQLKNKQQNSIELYSYWHEDTSDEAGILIGSHHLSPGESINARYDFAGVKGDSHYSIKCFDQEGKQINCSATIELVPQFHNRACIVGKTGPGGTYEFLNMNQGNLSGHPTINAAAQQKILENTMR